MILDSLSDSSIAWNIDNVWVAGLKSILLSQGQSLYHDNALYISNYYFYFIEVNKTFRHVGLQLQLHDLGFVLKKERNSKTLNGH
jgi:hypothetical protein